MEIDTDLANKEMFKNYQQQIDDESPSEIEKDQHILQNMMMNIEGEDSNMLKDEDPDYEKDHQVRNFLEGLKQVGPLSKQILNYTYPPLLYQRGEEDDDEEEEDGLPDIEQDYDDDEDIQELIKGGQEGMLNNEDLYAKLQNILKEKDSKR